MTFLKDTEPHHIAPPPPRSRRNKRKAKGATPRVKKAVDRRALVAGKLPDLGPVPHLDESLGRLLDMLSYRRPSESDSELEFISTFIEPTGAVEDDYGNLWVEVASDDGKPGVILWSVHTDTVHHDPGRQAILLKGPLAYQADSNCLGADDTAGVWLALEMIRAQVPGTYVFHRDEESGGGGSLWSAKNHADWLGRFKAAIALDRKGYSNVITHQFGARCCSEAFAVSLAAILGGTYSPDDTGLFTDTANYTDNIGECTNISVGYFDQHGPTECLNIDFLRELRDRMISADWSTLVFERKPGDTEWADGWGGLRGQPYSHQRNRWDDDDDGAYEFPAVKARGAGEGRFLPLADTSLVRFVRDNYDAVADLLEQDGWEAQTLAEYLGLAEEAA